ncbi:glycoside hydrolase family 15 protein [Nocardioides sp. SR21]|uniref:glycoside hydrolase family 15 protein n=1 Tax=Nocardioides sp. SR21 TaxID=2919501 RepID=UPI001FAA6B92|nr:glycoside hydrolase family 15 protein [Nocardioides sp. SR21]
MFLRLVAGATAFALSAPLSPSTAAPAPPEDRPARQSTWAEADKTGFGTARATRSNVWFTLQRGRVSEVFYPDLSTPSARSLEFQVWGEEFSDKLSQDATTATTRSDPRSLRYTQVATDEDGHYRVVQEYVTDPRHDTLLVRARLVSLDGGDYRLVVKYHPALDNGGGDDREADGPWNQLRATDGTVSSALLARPGLEGTSTHGTVTDDIVQESLLADRVTLALGFGDTVGRAVSQARGSLRAGFGAARAAYDRGWHRYLDSLKGVPASAAPVEREYLASQLVLAAAEDKLHRGAFVASPSMPWVWGDQVEDLSLPSGAYHLVWSRDAYQFGTALWAAGDRAAARRTVRWLFGTQQRNDGSFPQNSDVAGTPVWESIQLDEVALPIVLAHLVGADGERTWRGVRKAVEFLLSFRDEESGRRAPYSTQERWENQSGYSPNSIATQIAGLVCAADLARKHGHRALARQWLEVADRWHRHVKDWTVTRNGPLSDQPYFLRLSKDGQPSRGASYEMGDGGPTSIDQREVVDPSFLDLVRLGVLAFDDPAVVNTLDVVDQELEVETPNGSFWRRFSHDGYGETRTGGQWTITEPGTGTTLGRGWPILTGERGEYVVDAGEDASSYLLAMAAAAGPGDMISEQVWDGRPPTGAACCAAGEGTRAATPLVWSHAQLVRLAWTIQRGSPVDRPAVVADRYLR